MRVLSRDNPRCESHVRLIMVAIGFASAAIVASVYGFSVAWPLWRTITISAGCIIVFGAMLIAVLLEFRDSSRPLLIAARVLSTSQETANVLYWDYPQRTDIENDPIVSRDIFQMPIAKLPSECITPQSQIWIVATPYDYLVQQVLPRVDASQPADERFKKIWKIWSNENQRFKAQNSA